MTEKESVLNKLAKKHTAEKVGKLCKSWKDFKRIMVNGHEFKEGNFRWLEEIERAVDIALEDKKENVSLEEHKKALKDIKYWKNTWRLEKAEWNKISVAFQKKLNEESVSLEWLEGKIKELREDMRLCESTESPDCFYCKSEDLLSSARKHSAEYRER